MGVGESEEVSLILREVKWAPEPIQKYDVMDAKGTKVGTTFREDEVAVPELAFGVEIEFIGISLSDAHGGLLKAGYAVDLITHSIHASHGEWKVVPDASVWSERWHDDECPADYDEDECTCGLPDDAMGGELVSPILQGLKGLKELANILKTLQELGAFVDHNCGLHVHVDARGFGPHEILQVVRRFVMHEDQINALHPSRLANTYCQPISRRVDEEFLKRVTHLSGLRSRLHRYMTLNVHSLMRHGTLEFRQHAGTVDPTVACQWVRWCLHFMEASRLTKDSCTRIPLPAEQKERLRRLLELLKFKSWSLVPEDLIDTIKADSSCLHSWGVPVRVFNGYHGWRIENTGYFGEDENEEKFWGCAEIRAFLDSEFKEKTYTEKLSLSEDLPPWEEGMPEDLILHYQGTPR